VTRLHLLCWISTLSFFQLGAPPLAHAQEIEWVRQFGTAGQDRASAIAVNASGVFIGGATEAAFPGYQSAGAVDAFVMRLDSNGSVVWIRQFGTPGIDEVLAIALDETGVYVGGDTQGTLSAAAPAGAHAFIRKYDLDGIEGWTREFGSGRREEVLALAAGAGAVYAAGDTTVTTPPFDDAFVVAIGADGTTRGGHEFGTPTVDHASAIAVNASGVYVAGATQGALPGQSSAGDSDSFLRKYGLDGSEFWTRQMGTSESDEILSIALDASGIYVAGTTGAAMPGQTASGAGDVFVSKYDLSGQLLWTREFGTSAYDDALGIAVNPRGVYIAGNTKGELPGQVSAGDSDFFVRKFDARGNASWARQVGGRAHDEALAIAVGGSDLYVVGVTEGVLPGQTNKGSADAFIVKLRDR
jgi:hypothetical protein